METNQNPTTLGDHLTRLAQGVHDAAQAYNQDRLTPADLAASLRKELSHLERDFPPEGKAFVTESSVTDLLTGFLARAQERKTAAPTGIASLSDALNGGFQKKRLVTLLGAPGSGKTSLANQMAEHAALEHPVLYVTSEDSPDVLLAKTIARLGGIHYSDVLYAPEKCRDSIARTLNDLAARSSATNLHYLDVTGGSISINALRDRAAMHFEGKPGPGLIVIDYLQRMARATRESGSVKDLREVVSYLAERLRAIACELECCVLAVASMNRQSDYGRDSEKNIMAAAKESGDIEYSADVVMGLVEDNTRKPKPSYLAARRLRIDKNRQGQTTVISLDWYANLQQFTAVCEASHD